MASTSRVAASYATTTTTTTTPRILITAWKRVSLASVLTTHPILTCSASSSATRRRRRSTTRRTGSRTCATTTSGQDNASLLGLGFLFKKDGIDLDWDSFSLGGMKVARGLKVCWLALRLYLDFRKTKSKAKALKRDLGLDDKDPESDWNEDIVALWHEANLRSANLVYDQICNLRGLWVKAGQFISSRPDIVAPEYVQVLSKLQDAIPARPWEEVEATLVKELGGDWNEKHFKSVDKEPLSTASIAQVHRAVMHDGAQVVVKVAHSGIRSQMLSDLRILSYLVRVLAVLEKDQDYRKIVQEWSPAVKSEIDLRNESENMERVRNSMIKGGVEVEIPKPVMSTSSVLVMNFLEGFSPKNKEMLESSGVDKALFMQRLCECFAEQIHRNGFYHADPHPGNIFVGENSVPVLLDFGLCKEFTPSAKVAFSKLVYSSYSQDLGELQKAFVEMGLLINDGAKDEVRDMKIMRRLFTTTPVSKVKEKKLEMAKERKAREEEQKAKNAPQVKKPLDAWPAELVFFGRVTGLLKGLCSNLDLEFPYLEVMANAAVKTVRDSARAEHGIEAAAFPSPPSPSPSHTSATLQKRLEDVVSSKLDPESAGLQVTVMREGEILAGLAAGCMSATDPRPVTEKTLFNVFSAGKGLLAASVHLLLQMGLVRSLDDKVTDYWPEFGAEGKDAITVRQLLSHEAGLAKSGMLTDGGLDAMLDFSSMLKHVANASMDEKAVGRYEYHAISYCWCIGGLVQGASGMPLDKFIETNILEPLKLNDEIFVGVPSKVVEENLRLASISNPQM